MEFFRVVLLGDPIKVKNYIKNHAVDINAQVNKTRAIDIAWSEYLKSNNETMTELLMNENSMYPKAFDINLLSPKSKIRALAEFSNSLQTKSPQDIDKMISSYQHLYYFFDLKNKTLLYHLLKRKKVIPHKVVTRLLLGPDEMLYDTRNIKSLIRINTQFKDKYKKQELCSDLSNHIYNCEMTTLSMIVQYPSPITLIFDYTKPIDSLIRDHLVFYIGSKGNYFNFQTVLKCIHEELFNGFNFDEYNLIVNDALEETGLVSLKQKLYNRMVFFQNRLVKFSDIKPIYPLNRHLIKRVLFNGHISFGLSPPPLPRTPIEFVESYSVLNIIHCNSTTNPLYGVYHKFHETKPDNWLWYIDVSTLTLDHTCTGRTLLQNAYMTYSKNSLKDKYCWQMFLQCYQEHRSILFFNGVDRLQHIIRERVLKVIQHDLTCPRWILTNTPRNLLGGPDIDLYLVIFDVNLASISLFSELMGPEYIAKLYYPPNKEAFVVLSKNETHNTDSKRILLSMEPAILPEDTFSCIQINFSLFSRYNGRMGDIKSSEMFKARIKYFENKTYQLYNFE